MPIVAWKQLLQAVRGAQARFFSLIDEYGLFVAQSALESVLGKEEECDPQELSERLRRLANREYDPMFDKECSDFAEAFWRSVQQLMQIANDQNALPVRDRNEYAKIDALKAYADEWTRALKMALDRAYQAQKADMLDVYEKLRRIATDLAEAVKARENSESQKNGAAR